MHTIQVAAAAPFPKVRTNQLVAAATAAEPPLTASSPVLALACHLQGFGSTL